MKTLLAASFLAFCPFISTSASDCSWPAPNGDYQDGAWLTMNEDRVAVVQGIEGHTGMVVYSKVTTSAYPFGYGEGCLAPGLMTRGDIRMFGPGGQTYFDSPPIIEAPNNYWAQVLYRDVDGQMNTTNMIAVLPMDLGD